MQAAGFLQCFIENADDFLGIVGAADFSGIAEDVVVIGAGSGRQVLYRRFLEAVALGHLDDPQRLLVFGQLHLSLRQALWSWSRLAMTHALPAHA